MKIYPSIEQYNIRFGLKREKVRAILGEPSSVDIINVSEQADLECWTYDAHQIELIFDSENSYRLFSISFASENVKVEDVAIIGLKEKKLLKKFPELYCQDEKDEIGYNYEYPGENLMFWVSDGIVKLLTVYK
ncbi:MAG: outer membrane protein assembly factor BamE [Deltaproteobacteria bacterium]|nr:outer membrane protein assembly factor BamE [Deltaproteobacteria bacterium]